MQNERENLSERLLNFAASIVKLAQLLSKTVAGRHIAGQILRSSTSCGANYEEACGAESRADFIHKMQIVLKELRETLYWLKLSAKCFPNLAQYLQADLKEGDELIRIFSKSVNHRQNPRPIILQFAFCNLQFEIGRQRLVDLIFVNPPIKIFEVLSSKD